MLLRLFDHEQVLAAKRYVQARELAEQGEYETALALIEAHIREYPYSATHLLALAYDIFYVMTPDQSRYGQYQHRLLDFGLQPTDKILDMGSGHIPFPQATVLADISLDDGSIGRAGSEFKHLPGKQAVQCSVEKTPFADKEFDFVYCSHVLEHVDDPLAACKELMRIGKRGYIETPLKGKDTLFNTPKLSNHKWSLELVHGTLVFTPYDSKDLEGVGSFLMLDINCGPRTPREKAVAALYLLRAQQFNVMFLWDDHFPVQVREKPAFDSTSTRQAGIPALETWLDKLPPARGSDSSFVWKYLLARVQSHLSFHPLVRAGRRLLAAFAKPKTGATHD